MESYDIIANQPVVIDNVSRDSGVGGGLCPAQGSHAAPRSGPRWWDQCPLAAPAGPSVGLGTPSLGAQNVQDSRT